MKLVDLESKQFLKQLSRDKIKRAPPQPSKENANINAFLYTSHTELNNIVAQEIKIQNGTQMSFS